MSWATYQRFRRENLIPEMAGVTIKEKTNLTQQSKLGQTTESDENGLLFALDCNDPCFINKAEYNHLIHQVELNKVEEYAVFPSMWYHHGYNV